MHMMFRIVRGAGDGHMVFCSDGWRDGVVVNMHSKDTGYTISKQYYGMNGHGHVHYGSHITH